VHGAVPSKSEPTTIADSAEKLVTHRVRLEKSSMDGAVF
jgi:hypothetical protein